MPEIEECRKCADCCGACIFLEIDRKSKLFDCLIYKNKWRRPVLSSLLLDIHFGKYEDENPYQNGFFNKIESMITRKYLSGYSSDKVCDGFICFHLTRNKKTPCKTNDLNYWNYSVKSRIRRIKKARKLIPDFDVLVEILNN